MFSVVQAEDQIITVDKWRQKLNSGKGMSEVNFFWRWFMHGGQAADSCTLEKPWFWLPLNVVSVHFNKQVFIGMWCQSDVFCYFALLFGDRQKEHLQLNSIILRSHRSLQFEMTLGADMRAVLYSNKTLVVPNPCNNLVLFLLAFHCA